LPFAILHFLNLSTMPLTTEDFIREATPSLEKLRARFGDTPPKVSDIVDAQGHQYVNLVQEGGGVLGVALVGYTYVLEQMGIRFMRMAGTSAGAINTMLMTCLGNKEDAKSLAVLEEINKKPFFDFVDGSTTARNMIRRLITSKSYMKRLLWTVGITLGAFVIAFPLFTYAWGTGSRSWLFWAALILALASFSGIVYMVWWVISSRQKFYKAEFGINPGKQFEDWISGILAKCNIHNLKDLEAHVQKVPEGLFRSAHPEPDMSLEDLNKPVLADFLSIVTSDLTNQMKVEFPRMWSLYWDDPAKVSPAFFVRASMAVPFFFKPFIIKDIAPDKVLPAWGQFIGMEDKERIPNIARFVDGGMLSNFPINVFFNPKIAKPRLPTFGIRLDDTDPKTQKDQYDTIGGFAGAMISTLRSHYDKEFLLKNADFNRTVGRIDVSGINWLNFNISDAEKLKLFRRGAEAAARFFLGPDPKPGEEGLESTGSGGFDWEYYKVKREEMKTMLEK
jgi:NTE family protein